MNRLAFGEFHEKHFGSAQKAYWSSLLQQQSAQHPDQGYDSNHQEHHNYDPNQHYFDPNQYYSEYQHDLNGQYSEYYYDQEEYLEEEEYGGLSKEAIEIFRFSEAYRKERELEKQKELEEDTAGMDNWQYDESNVHCSGGLEAPASSLVLLKPESERPPKNTKLRIQEELVNSAYMKSCSNTSTPIVLWPVLPFKM